MDDKAKALEMALDMADRKKNNRPSPWATCPACDEPLISTLKFPKKEFICVVCRRTWSFLEPKPVEATPELEARYKVLKAKWDVENKWIK